MLLEQPTSSQSAFLIHVVTTSLIIISAVVTVLETVPAFHSISGSIWFGLETALVALFTVEYIARCIAHTSSWRGFLKWFSSFFGIIDLLGIVPYYIEIASQQDTVHHLAYIQVAACISAFPLQQHNSIARHPLPRSQHALLALAFFVVMVLIVFSTLLYFAERGSWDETLGTFMNSDGDPSQFASIPAAGWFVLVTITTVGYGEITPRSFLGRLITLPLLVFGLLLIALPTFVLGREFSIVWELMRENQRSRDDDEDDGHVPDPLDSPLLSRNRSMRDLRLDASMTGLWGHPRDEPTVETPPMQT
ncbi:Potassium voltage-gated channel subfamily B member 1 [Grifola frondosa]|uniref:Potassium voltage-gated channel subfamily B member 1 n=1 Tax=Grifola frondosa TaxID=5627 RepID=A0A1C7LW67_GRIFR|nr:Potassium voltage-gated channel subfamily B member 1 [Grifola frondosa]